VNQKYQNGVKRIFQRKKRNILMGKLFVECVLINLKWRIKMVKCEYCKGLIESNPKYVLKVLTGLGYEDYDFHNLDCFLRYILKKFKRKLKKWE